MNKQLAILLILLMIPVSVFSGAPRKVKGGVEFSYENPNTDQVYLVGQFNDWDTKSHPMTKDDKGIWRITVKLDRGTYQYKFYYDGQYIQDPDNPESDADPYGGRNSLITVNRYGNVVKSVKQEKLVSNTPLSSRVNIGGMYYGQYYWHPDPGDEQRWRLDTPVHNINLEISSKINDNITLKTSMAINNQVEGVDLWKSHLRFFNSYLEFKGDQFDLIAYDNYEVVQFNDPAALFGNVGIFNHAFGRNTRGIVLKFYPFSSDLIFIYGDAMGNDSTDFYSPAVANRYSQYTDYLGLRFQKKVTDWLLGGISGRMDRGFDSKNILDPDQNNTNFETHAVNITYGLDLEFFKDFNEKQNALNIKLEYLKGKDYVQATSFDEGITGEYQSIDRTWDTRDSSEMIAELEFTWKKYFKVNLKMDSVQTELTGAGVYFATFDPNYDRVESGIMRQSVNVSYQWNRPRVTWYFGLGMVKKSFDWRENMIWDLNEQLGYRPPFFSPVSYSEFIWLGYDQYTFLTPSLKFKTIDHRLVLDIESKISAYDIGYEPRSMENIARINFFFTETQRFGLFANLRNIKYSDKEGFLGFEESFNNVYGGFIYQLGKNVKMEIAYGNYINIEPVYMHSLMFRENDPYAREKYLIENGPDYYDLNNYNYYSTEFADDLYQAEKSLENLEQVGIRAVIEF